jgi:serine/threonine protein kinase/Tol biopolymer transport system component
VTLAVGSRVGSYEVIALIGAGGMGEVYRARDTKLNRDVAIKVLPEQVARDPQRLERFTREAQTLAALNHPHIAHIHGLDENGDLRALVMELVDGQDLARLIASGPIPLADVLSMARQIAEGLEAAHEQHIIHRDLKPANIKVRPDGVVKVLDFGLAKALDPIATSPAAIADASTVDCPPGMTRPGVVLGTAEYMSPEQAKGYLVDKRTDIWAFGCVVYEALTGKRAFAGDTLADVLAAVVSNEPDWKSLPSDTPLPIRALLRRCLQKDPSRRLHDIADARIEIEESVAASPDSPALDTSRRRGIIGSRAVPWIIGTVSALALLVMYVALRRPALDNRPLARLELTLPSGVEPYIGPSAVAFSPDGTRIAFVASTAGNRQLYIRRLDEFDARPLKGTEGATAAFFSPDGRSVAVIQTDRTLKKVSLDDGLVISLASDADYTTGGAWGADGRITFGRDRALWQVPAAGGVATRLTTLDAGKGELLHAFPAALRDGNAILFATVTGPDRGASHIEAMSRGGDAPRRQEVVRSGSSPAYVASGHLIFSRDDLLLAAPFDEERLQVTGAAVRVADEVGLTPIGVPLFATSRSGALAYMSATEATRLVWVSRQGREEPLADVPRLYMTPRIAADGRRVVSSANGDLWVHDTARLTLSKLTNEATTSNTYGVWTPDAKRVVFRTSAGMHVIVADGSGRLQVIPDTTVSDYPNSISPDGETLLFLRTTANLAADLYVVPLRGSARPTPLVSTKAHEGGGQFSPDGKWVVYSSNESGQFQVFLRPFPGPDRKWLVAQAGKYVTWNRNGKELFYRDGNRMMVVDVSIRNEEPVLSPPRVLFEGRYEFGPGLTASDYDVSPDGQRFVMAKRESGSNRLSVLLNGFDDLAAGAQPR